jgi:tRNA(Arg) A34 adenosine deaminase TadA
MNEKPDRQAGCLLPAAASLTLPPWVEAFLANQAPILPDEDARMRLVIALARENIERHTGGPFGAAIFAQDSGLLVSVGVNRVVPEQASLAHAEMLAILFAQRRLASFDLGTPGFPPYELVTSAQMCTMCYGAIIWSGVGRVVCGAKREDVQEILGFDEGPLPASWERELADRGITVRLGVRRQEARELLRRYAELGAPVYNSRRQR